MVNQLDAAQVRMGLDLPANLADTLVEALCHPQFSGLIEARRVEKVPSKEELLGLARGFALSPISGFQVGAVAIAKSGNAYLGANMEFTGVPLHASLHAEQSAAINAWMHGESVIESLFVSEVPCGHCRQFLLELHEGPKLPIIVGGTSQTLDQLMPEPFAPKRSKAQGLLDSPPRKLIKIHPDDSSYSQRAINAASRSYTPYSQSPEGFIIETMNGQHFAGRTAECIAFNPSVPAVITALNQMNLSANRRESIIRCTHAKLATALTHSLAFSDALMRNISSVPVESVLMESAE